MKSVIPGFKRKVFTFVRDVWKTKNVELISFHSPSWTDRENAQKEVKRKEENIVYLENKSVVITPQRTVRTFAQFHTQALPTHEHRTVGQVGNDLEQPQADQLER